MSQYKIYGTPEFLSLCEKTAELRARLIELNNSAESLAERSFVRSEAVENFAYYYKKNAPKFVIDDFRAFKKMYTSQTQTKNEASK